MSALPADRGPPIPALPASAEALASRSRRSNRRGRGRRNNSPHPDDPNNNTGQALVSNSSAPRGRGRNRNRPSRQGGSRAADGESHQLPPHLTQDSQGDVSATESTGSHSQPRRGRGGSNRGNRNSNRGTQAPGRGGRRQHFGARLTEGSAQSAASSSEPPPPPPTSGDLTSRLIYSLSHKHDALECPICFNPVHPAQPIWSCAPATTAVGDAPVTCCWTIFHMKCIKEWARKSVEVTREAYRARNVDLPGEWRCPGCQTKRILVPQAYTCFCGRATNPAPSQLSTPHSCGEPCARVRGECEHACPLACHPGPCPPCLVSVSKGCWCGSKTIVSRCSVLNKGASNGPTTVPTLSCGQPCGRLLGCEKHTCQIECHPGPCTPCQVVDVVRCYCGKHEKDMPCGVGVSRDCSVEGEGTWEGRWQCEEICHRNFKCGKHKCQKPCHPPSETPAICPFSPSLVTTCPCTKTPLSVERTACTDPIRTCSKQCGRVHPECGHACGQVCHTGTCPPCTLPVAVKCRCGETTSQVPCNTLVDGQQILCQRTCKAMRGCGRHECNRVCCPLAGTASKFKGKRRMDLSSGTDVAEDDPEGWHTCDLICNKKLSCGNHNCTLPDHRGPCPRFVESPVKNVGIPALFPVMRLLPVHQLMPYLVLRSLPLAEALGISESGRSSGYTQIAWNPDLIAFARAPVNQPFVKNMEKALADFVAGDKKAHVLPHMPEVRRKIITEVAEVYRITTQLVDEEPRRSVQLIRRIDSRIPTPLLSQVSAPAPSRLGSLGDLRKPATVVKPASPSASSASTTPAWRSGTSSSHVNPNAASNLASSLGPPTSGSLPQVPSAVPWARPNGSSVAESPISSTPSRTTPALPERVRVAETREDVPANWEDD